MAAAGYLPHPIVSSQSPFAPTLPAGYAIERDAAAHPVGTPYSNTAASVTSILIRRLPNATTDDNLRLLLLFSQELIGAEFLSYEQSDDPNFRCAIAKFKTPGGAQQAKEMLHGKSMGDVELIVEILSGSPPPSRRHPIVSTASSGTSSANSSGPTSRQSDRYNGGFRSMDAMSPPSHGLYTGSELPNPESSAHYQSLFSPQSPIGNHLTERPRISGKTLISHDAAEDDDTRDILKNPIAFAENGFGYAESEAFATDNITTSHRRATAPHLPISRMANLSLNTSAPGPPSMPPYAHSNMTPMSAHTNTMSPTSVSTSSHSAPYLMGQQHYGRPSNFPPVNPADQNPPCNTLYVGNLPIDTSEEELKALFSKQRGYKRLCFRTKQNGPMCFVEFEDISFATKTLHELYGVPLHNSVKGGIRLSFSKNPLGVRSGQAPGQTGAGAMTGMNGAMPGSANGFTTASGPPPGLAAPPGLGRIGYGNGSTMSNGGSHPYSAGNFHGGSHVWSSALYSGPLSAGSPMGMNHTFAPFPSAHAVTK
ncbi:hypothetical protein F4780DRAFT_784381 [Xylariomycetidae sp. FL0641]|nr:hypothetical protein F4780DRAFT_784381 [Xylariomycetidae sp. FL0641]